MLLTVTAAAAAAAHLVDGKEDKQHGGGQKGRPLSRQPQTLNQALSRAH